MTDQTSNPTSGATGGTPSTPGTGPQGKAVDEVTGTATTGHEWDGIRELDTPLPRWWLWTFYATIIWSIGYWILYPAWPLATTYTKGLLGYSQRAVVEQEVAEARAALRKYDEQILSMPLVAVPASPELYAVALAGGESAFGDNCAPCHGRGAEGRPGYPNLRDDDWLWGGRLEDIRYTITHGVRWEADPETRFSEMPRFLADGILTRDQVADVTQYVLQISGREADPAAAARGAGIYAQQCVSCHMEDGRGNREVGAPNLTDAIWLYGGDEKTIFTSIAQSRRGVMPAWQGRLEEATIAKLALYVHSLGGGEPEPAP